MALMLPAGYKFCPTDKQLLENYLKPKIQGTLSWDFIQDKDIYGPNANPWEIFDDSSTQWVTSGHQKSVYVFTRLTRMADKDSSGEGNDGHYVRRAGCGTWHVETGRKSIMDDGNNPIGERRMLVFQINDSHGLKNGVKEYYWNMHEFLLKGNDDYVVCRITLDMSKTAKVISTTDVSARRGSTKSKASKKSATTRTTEDEREKEVLVDSFRDSGKEVASNIDDSGFSYENQRFHGESNELIYQNLVAPMSTLCHDGMPLYDYAGWIPTVEEQEGLQVLNDDQRLNNEEAAQLAVIPTDDGSQNLGTVLSDFNGGSHDDLYFDLDDMFGADFWSDIDNVLMMEPPLPTSDVSLDLEGFLDAAGSWSDQILEEVGQANNNVQEPQKQWQQPTQNMSCMLGKRDSFEAQQAGPTKRPRF